MVPSYIFGMIEVRSMPTLMLSVLIILFISEISHIYIRSLDVCEIDNVYCQKVKDICNAGLLCF